MRTVQRKGKKIRDRDMRKMEIREIRERQKTVRFSDRRYGRQRTVRYSDKKYGWQITVSYSDRR